MPAVNLVSRCLQGSMACPRQDARINEPAPPAVQQLQLYQPCHFRHEGLCLPQGLVLHPALPGEPQAAPQGALQGQPASTPVQHNKVSAYSS